MNNYASIVWLIASLALAPLVIGIINRTKALFAGRTGPPLVQYYYDIWKLLHKGAVYSRTTSWVFRASPVVSLATTVAALTMVPLGSVAAAVHFAGDMIVVLGLLAGGRFFTMLGALDTGSSFEGMGASREAHFAAMLEPVFFLCLAVLVRQSGGEVSLSLIYASLAAGQGSGALPVLILVGVALLGVFLVENARIPVDDPTTHLELTMIHEVMVLDHSGPDLAFIEYAASVKLWLLGSLVVGLFVPTSELNVWAAGLVAIVGTGVLAVIVGVIESMMARLRLRHVPSMIAGAGASAVVALFLTILGEL